MAPSRLVQVLRVGYAREVATGMQAGAGAGAPNPGLLTPARLKQIRLELVNQLPLILRDGDVLRIHAELMQNIGTMSEGEFRAKVNALNDANVASIQKEKTRLNGQYLSTFQSLSGSAAAASSPSFMVAPYQWQLPNRYVTFEEFCNGMNLSADMCARCRTAWQEGGGIKQVAKMLGNIVGKERLKAFLKTLDTTHYNMVLLHPNDPRGLQIDRDNEGANLLLSLQGP